ncbi:hypothetical protein N7481_013281 [Penicillium waksmanii]|uniref:uncharacterized protein n=1 Tax=Penicillium waksmanii TaxID=69791 RepID=UPI002548630D|nr:uncharacterized protein N7481_013281 [Penicillium waksmanii]KAJ5966567.1 hypothetical protein N7481_013281 [Penicillium waksmanii]
MFKGISCSPVAFDFDDTYLESSAEASVEAPAEHIAERGDGARRARDRDKQEFYHKVRIKFVYEDPRFIFI